VIVQEKLDGSNVAVGLLNGEILALGRAGYLAQSSRWEQHQLFAYWVRENEADFPRVLKEGERVCGEWLAQAHGTRYELKHGPFVGFDIMVGAERKTWQETQYRLSDYFVVPRVINIGFDPMSIEDALKEIRWSGHGALDPVEGAVWRVERDGKVDFLAKYVRHDKKSGCYLERETGKPAVWNWRP
jgi:ATP-dependent RNA circularization protein (DNA/RNA ligase family)